MDVSTLDVEVVRSARRRKTVQARMVAGRLRIAIPDRFSAEEEAHWVGVMTDRFARRRRTDAVDLQHRAEQLARRHDLPEPVEVVWSDRQHHRWGSCSPDSGRIRVSRAVGDFPGWVLDYVLVHELAHLRIAAHDDSFWRLVERYPLAERARGYLIAKSGERPPPLPSPHVAGAVR